MKKHLNWLKKNKQFINFRGIENEIGIPKGVLPSTVNEKIDGHGTPFKVPEKYHDALIELIKQIRK